MGDYLKSAKSRQLSVDLSHATFLECLEAMIDHKSKLKPKYGKNLSQLRHHIKLMEEEFECVIDPIQINEDFYTLFISRLLEFDLKPSTVEHLCYQIRSVIEWSSKHKASVSETYGEFHVPKYSKPLVHLTLDDVSRIYHLNLGPVVKRKDHRKTLEKVKDMFCLSCCLGQRHSDMVRIQPKNFDRNTFTIVQQKTGSKAVVDIDKFAMDRKMCYQILEKYNYTAPYPADISNFNKHMHKIMKLAGFNDVIMQERKVMGKVIEEHFPISKIVASHTARRTFVTINLQRGYKDYQVMRATGHKTIPMLYRYLDKDAD